MTRASINMHDYDAKSMAPIDLYGQLIRIIERLRDPLFLSENTRRMYGQILRDNLVEMCVAAARHDDRASVDALVELGYLDRETLLPVIEAVTKLQDAAMTGYLLELQRHLGGPRGRFRAVGSARRRGEYNGASRERKHETRDK